MSFLQHSFSFGCFKMNTYSFKTSPCTVFWGGEEVENTGKGQEAREGNRDRVLPWEAKRQRRGQEARVGLPGSSSLALVMTVTS